MIVSTYKLIIQHFFIQYGMFLKQHYVEIRILSNLVRPTVCESNTTVLNRNPLCDPTLSQKSHRVETSDRGAEWLRQREWI